MPEISNGKKLASSMLYSVTGRYLVYLVQLLSMMILARIFTPETFGIFAVIQVFAVFFALLSEMGFGPALINESKISTQMRDGIYSFTWVLGAAVSVIFFIISPLIAWFYGDDIYQYLVIPVGISIVFNTSVIVPMSALNREKKFITIARCEAIAEIISVVFLLLTLDYFEPIWALAIKPLVVSIFRYILILFAAKNTEEGIPHFGRELGHVKKILAFSKDQAGFNFLNYFSKNLDNILVGKYLGATSLGIYDKAYRLMRYPLLILTFAMAPAIQPVMKELRENPPEFERLHIKFTKYMSLLGALVGILICIFADEIVFILLGDKWGDVSILLRILSISIPTQVVISSSGGFYQAAGRADLLLKCGFYHAITSVSAIVIGVYLGGLETLCWLIVISFTINFIQCYLLMSKHIFPSGLSSVFGTISYGVISSVIILAANFVLATNF
ncbi:lipopolysaccharide biosynthesis protein [Shewanella sp. 6_MG-2023]|uniref:lipopolysaccharide biosynthesis protein n=1 Tax=Shewanella sp. 6_MG-2023 TaxID=3062660 RepID=UPI0026E263ED|nr:lipopolysaccharide biosynthesis protein [Shewanella sp. 6_MG-2023]MDO6619788.1 lipopolysaccharide biosynthesis protein [Shewanella sp. 6_MG-2023]